MKKGYVEHYGLNPRKIKIIPNWINLERFKVQDSRFKDKKTSNFQSRIKNILFVHWLSKRKGADMIVPIIKHLFNDFPLLAEKIKLKVIGNGPYKQALIKAIQDNHLEKVIEVIGGVPNKEIVGYYQEADLLLMPSMEEGFPRVILEAMAMGLPYIASDVGCVREISTPTAQRFLVKPGNVAMFAHKIEALITDKETYRKFAEEGLENVKKYSLQKVIDRFINLFI